MFNLNRERFCKVRLCYDSIIICVFYFSKGFGFQQLVKHFTESYTMHLRTELV